MRREEREEGGRGLGEEREEGKGRNEREERKGMEEGSIV